MSKYARGRKRVTETKEKSLHLIISLNCNMYQIYNDEDEFEPRITPKPASKLDCFAVPLVPEVSLIFDKPLPYNTVERKDFHSPSSESSLTHKKNVSSPLNANGSYAAWKEQNYSWRGPTANVNCVTPGTQSVQSRSYSSETNAPKSRERSPMGVRNAKYKGQVYSESNDNLYKHSFERCEGNVAYVEKRQSPRARYDSATKRTDVASTRTNVESSANSANRQYPPLLYEGKLVTHSAEQQKISNDSMNEPFLPNLINPNTLKRNELQLPHYLGQQYPYFNVNTYPFPQLHPYAPQNTDNQETLKNLLQIINNQNEQIKSLQTQVDRLLKMQEESFKERKNCSCSSRVYQQSNQLSTNSDIDASCVREPQNSARAVYSNESPKSRRNDTSILKDSESVNELILAEAQSRKAFMEQKVSIGVMTSFEFTVQNSPFVDIEDYEKESQDNPKVCNNGLRDVNSESLRRYKNSFTRMPSAPLENIVEDSESYMSSQQQSSNLNASVSVKDLERQTDIRKETDTCRSESPKCKNVTAKKSTENDTQKLRRVNEGGRNYETVKTPVPKGIEYHVPRNSNRKANPIDTDQYTNLNTQKDDSKASNSDSSTGYYKDCRKEAVTKRANCVEDSLILNGGDLNINERPPTPEPSIHVDMNEYSSDDDSEKVKRSSKVGWTFYNNVLGQVNQLLQNSCVTDDQDQKEKQNERDETENRVVLDTVKVATLEQLKKLGISLSENPERKESNNSNKRGFDLSFYPRLDYQANMTQTTSANETNTSMHMKALALKYLSDEQLAELAIQRQGSASVKHLMLGNVQATNMSFATMRYLERYQLLPGKNNVQTEDISKVQEAPPKTDLKLGNPKGSPALHRFPFTQTPRTTCPSKILDISTLKQQPKLL